MIKSFIIAFTGLFVFGASALNLNVPVLDHSQLEEVLVSNPPAALDWKVGDNANYNIKAGFINGKMKMYVASESNQGFWLNQDMDLGFAGKQKVETHIDKNTGAILEMKVNGQKQDPPDAGDTTVEETKEDMVTVPAGTFKSIYIKMRNNKDNSVAEAWINPADIPMSGLIKQMADSQLGKVVLELTSFERK